MIDVQSIMSVSIALSSTEVEYMGACNTGSMMCNLKDHLYLVHRNNFEFLDAPSYDDENTTDEVLPILLHVY